MVTVLAELVNVPDAPLQVMVGAGDVWSARLAGTVSVKPDWVKSKALALLKVMVSVGENASVTVGAEVVTVNGVGQAPALVPAEAPTRGPLVMAPPVATDSVAVSV